MPRDPIEDAREVLDMYRRDSPDVGLSGTLNIVESMLAIIDGRDVPPTQAEDEALADAGGWWRWLSSNGSFGDACAGAADAMVITHTIVRWWAVDRTGKLRAWPQTGAAP